jgi:hypothetical protein
MTASPRSSPFVGALVADLGTFALVFSRMFSSFSAETKVGAVGRGFATTPDFLTSSLINWWLQVLLKSDGRAKVRLTGVSSRAEQRQQEEGLMVRMFESSHGR